jgi:hypothetical protein
MTRLVFATGRLLELSTSHRQLLMSVSDLERISYAMRHLSKRLAKAPHWQMIEKYWNTAMQQNDI